MNFPSCRTLLTRSMSSARDELWWVAGSTHPGEEEIVLDVYSKVIKDNPKWRLVIAPRHVERAPQIKDLIAHHGLKDVIVIDTIGQLRFFVFQSLPWYLSEKVYAWGEGIISLNRLFMARPLSLGPRSRISGILLLVLRNKTRIVQVEDAHSFETAVRDLCADASKREALGTAAHAVSLPPTRGPPNAV